MRNSLRGCVIAAATVAAGINVASARELKIGLSAEPTSADPHYHYFVPNIALHAHVFEALTVMDAKQALKPSLATSWRSIDDTTWEFKLRQGVSFSNGTSFGAKDVVYTICRVPNVANSPGSFTISTRSIADMQVKDAETLVIKTERPNPLLPIELSTVGIVSAAAAGATGDLQFDRAGCRGVADWPKSEDFNSLKLAVGTGPFKLTQFTRGDRIVLDRNDAYWGTKPDWTRVTLRPIGSAGPRVAALLSGDVDFIENPPVQDLDRIRNTPNMAVAQVASSRVIYLGLNMAKEPAPGIEGPEKNPLRDPRVRQALLKAIDREGITTRIMRGLAFPAAELLPNFMFGANENVAIPAADVAGARKLLAEAGYPNGFKLLLGSPNERYPNDAAVAQAVAQLFSRIGVETSVEALPAATFFPKANGGGYSVWLTGWLADTGEMSNPLRSFVMTPNKDKGFGAFNGGYSNPEVDRLVEEAIATVDNAKRRALLQRASKTAMEDVGVIPLYFQAATWAHRKDLSYAPRTNERTVITDIKPTR